ncbi:hypothetical protein ACFWPA_08800 [Rhodococcus sp. NPDC058505]
MSPSRGRAPTAPAHDQGAPMGSLEYIGLEDLIGLIIDNKPIIVPF